MHLLYATSVNQTLDYPNVFASSQLVQIFEVELYVHVCMYGWIRSDCIPVYVMHTSYVICVFVLFIDAERLAPHHGGPFCDRDNLVPAYDWRCRADAACQPNDGTRCGNSGHYQCELVVQFG